MIVFCGSTGRPVDPDRLRDALQHVLREQLHITRVRGKMDYTCCAIRRAAGSMPPKEAMETLERTHTSRKAVGILWHRVCLVDYWHRHGRRNLQIKVKKDVIGRCVSCKN
jgi:hypothetical protein